MRKTSALFLGFLLLTASSAFADGEKVITLKDGSRINGRITGIEHGQYVIETGAMGQVQVAEDNVQSIVAPGMAVASEQPGQGNQPPIDQVPPKYNDQMKQMQEQIMGNPALMRDISTMAQDPEILKLLNDPALLEAATRGNPQALQANPRTQELMNNPKMQELIRKIQQAQGGSQAAGQ